MTTIREIKITVQAVDDDGMITYKVFQPKEEEDPEDAVVKFDQWIATNFENLEFEEQETL